MKKVRVRFAPSPTGGLHLGGVRTVLYNYLFAKKNDGQFVLRIEDTDQTRYVEGAEAYIFKCLQWCGLLPDESAIHGGSFAPYRQSERKEIYKKYVAQLLESGHAYYAFDTPQELEAMREQLKAIGSDSLQYDHNIRMKMNNSLRLLPEETKALLAADTPHVIRLKISANETVHLNDMVRGQLSFDTNTLDDKVLMKADGMPTYHLAVVVDDFLMRITHAFRGEEWLPSAPAHVLLWKYLFGLEQMPQWAHLPLILKPDGHGKLSKRDGERLGFPVYTMNWKDPASGNIAPGFKEQGFLPEAFLNMLAVLGWNDGTEQEIFSMEELIEKFSIERVHKAGAKFDFEKAKWYNHEWIKKLPVTHYAENVQSIFKNNGLTVNNDNYFHTILNLVKDRCTLLTDFYEQAGYFFIAPTAIDSASILPKWTAEKTAFFEAYIKVLLNVPTWDAAAAEEAFKLLAASHNIKPGELQLPMRIMLVGGKFGPGVFEIAFHIGRENTVSRLQQGLQLLKK